MERKIETKIVTALMFSHSDNLKPWIKCHGSNTPSSPHPAAAYLWYCQSSSLTEYATFFFLFFCFLSMEFIAELPYKSPRLSGCFHTFSFLTIILKTIWDPTTATVTRSSKTYNRVNIKNNFARTLLFCTFFLPSLHICDVKMPNFMLYDEIFLFFLNVHMDLWNSTLRELPRFDKVSPVNHDKDGKNVISLFERDVFATIAIVGS